MELFTTMATMLETIEVTEPTVEMASSFGKGTELAWNEEMAHSLNMMVEQDKYRKVAELREVAAEAPEATRAAFNDIQLKGQAGEGIFEAALRQYGEVNSQVEVQLEGFATANRVDLQLPEATEHLKQLEMTMQDGQVLLDSNYDVMKGQSASFEVKNGGVEYIRQEIANGGLPQQILAGKDISDHSFVVINEDTARELMNRPQTTERILHEIHQAGGKLIVGLPKEEYQMAILLS